MDALPLWTSIVATDVLGLAAGAWLLWGGRRAAGSSWSADAWRLACLGAALGLVTLAAGKAIGGFFFALRLWCHVLFCVLVPLCMARAIQLRGALGLTVIALGLAAESAYCWARRIEPYRLEITRHVIASPRLAGAPGPLRVAVLTDLQTDSIGAFQERVFAALDAERPDLLLVPGDLLQLGAPGSTPEADARARAELARLFGQLRPPRLGILVVDGDCDPREFTRPLAGLPKLANEVVSFPAERLQIIGLTSRSSRSRLEGELAAAARDFDGLTIVMGHAPDFALSLRDLGVPVLAVAGHTHGGQVQLPFLGPLITLSRVPRAMAAGGLHPIGDSWLCVSRGIGMEGGYAPRIRFLCRPELVVLELRPGAPASPSAGTTAAASPAAPDRAASTR